MGTRGHGEKTTDGVSDCICFLVTELYAVRVKGNSSLFLVHSLAASPYLPFTVSPSNHLWQSTGFFHMFLNRRLRNRCVEMLPR